MQTPLSRLYRSPNRCLTTPSPVSYSSPCASTSSPTSTNSTLSFSPHLKPYLKPSFRYLLSSKRTIALFLLVPLLVFIFSSIFLPFRHLARLHIQDHNNHNHFTNHRHAHSTSLSYHSSIHLSEPKLVLVHQHTHSTQHIDDDQPLDLPHDSHTHSQDHSIVSSDEIGISSIDTDQHKKPALPIIPKIEPPSEQLLLSEETDPDLLLPTSSRQTADGKPVHDPTDINNPTKINCSSNRGCAPRQLPASHPLKSLLCQIRRKTLIRPRWPAHPSAYTEKLKSYGPAYSSIVVSHQLKVVYIPVFKVGTTSMMWHLAYLEGNLEILQAASGPQDVFDVLLHDMGGSAWQNHTVYEQNAEQIREILDDPTYLKFGFVRNPFDRLVSAYVDKILRFPPTSTEYQAQMRGLYGEDVMLRRAANYSKPSFREFVYRIAKVIHTPRTKTEDLRSAQAYEDTRTRRDIHWRPQVELLHPDLVHLDFVGRFENMDKDKEIVLDWIYKHTSRRMPQHGHRKMHASNPQFKRAVFDMLKRDPHLVSLIVNMYREDFETFGFDATVP